jgi:hypothetical protein
MVRTSLFVLALCIASPVLANDLGESAAPRPDERGTYTIVWENDVFLDTDQNYTNGFRASYLSGTTRSSDGPEGWIAKKIIGVPETAAVRRGIAFGHSIFTPQDIEEEGALPDQHPYAGWVYGEYSAVIERKNEVDQISLQVGLVGPSAAGEFVQNEVHDRIGSPEARGWDNQIGDELGVVLAYDKRFRNLAKIGDDDLGADLTPNLGASVGNIHTNARAGLTFRFGENLRNDFGPPRVRPALGGAGYFNPIDDFSWYLFAGVEGRAVAHNIFLDGSLFDDNSPSVDSKTFVADFQGGAVVQYKNTQLALTYVERTDEFDTQEERQAFGAISLSVKY